MAGAPLRSRARPHTSLPEAVHPGDPCNNVAWRETYKRVANRAQVDRIVALAMKHRPSTDFCGYWQRGRAPRASVTACRVDELPIIGHAHHVRAIRRVRSRFPRGRDTQNPEIAKPASEGGSAYPANRGSRLSCQ